jgi:hypothetical protein
MLFLEMKLPANLMILSPISQEMLAYGKMGLSIKKAELLMTERQ